MEKLMLKNTKKYPGLEKYQKVIPDEDTALKLVADLKWKNGFICSKCGNTNYCKGKAIESRRCTRCKKIESATAHTVFHRCKIPINRALEIAYMVCNISAISSYELSRQLDIRHMTCYGFQKKVKECLTGENDDKLLKAILSVVHERVNSLS